MSPRMFSLHLCLVLSAALAAPAFAQSDEGGDATEEAPADDAPAEGEEGAAEGAEAAAEAAEAAAEGAEAAAEGAEAAAEAAEAAAEAAEAAAEAVEEAPAEEAPAEEAAAEEEKKPVAKMVAELGVNFLYGNTRSLNANGLINVSVAGDGNKFAWHFGGTYGRGRPDAAGQPLDFSQWIETARRIHGGARYDRSLVPDVNSIYFAGSGLHDRFGGLEFQAAANVGYSHVIVNTDKHNLVGEAGFNYTYDLYLDGADPADQHFAGARLFIGYGLTLESFGFNQSVEALLGGRNNMDAPFDGRIISNTSVTANINNILAVKFGFIVNYDIAPPVGFEAVDTTTTLTLVATVQ